jgi:hypothetical protein
MLELLSKSDYIRMFPQNTYLDFYRSRIGSYLCCDNDQMMAPQYGKAADGRCNPNGISYLYLSSNEETSISEVRPNVGDIVTIAKFNVDVSNIFSFKVFFSKYGPKIQNRDAEILVSLIDQDMGSVVTNDNTLVYIPLQYISEFIKMKGFDGYVYSSTVGQE